MFFFSLQRLHQPGGPRMDMFSKRWVSSWSYTYDPYLDYFAQHGSCSFHVLNKICFANTLKTLFRVSPSGHSTRGDYSSFSHGNVLQQLFMLMPMLLTDDLFHMLVSTASPFAGVLRG